MSQTTTKCPFCNNLMQIQTEWFGMNAECPICKKMFLIQPENQAQPAVNPVKNMAAAGTFTFICPSCDGKVELSENLRGTQYECQFCFDTHIANAALADTMPVQQPVKEEAKFIFICPECDTVAELPESAKDKEYECLCCCETVIAKPAEERTCPNCKEKVKIKATICKHCKSGILPIIPSNTGTGNKQITGGTPSLQPLNAGGNQAFSSYLPFTGTNANIPPASNNVITPELVRNKTWTGLVLWNLLMPGAGHLYLGQKSKGIQCIAIIIVLLVASFFLSFIPGIGTFIGSILFLCGCGFIIGESFATLTTLQMGEVVDRDKWLPRAQQQRVIKAMPPALKKKYMASLSIIIAALLLGITGPGILTWIVFFVSIL